MSIKTRYFSVLAAIAAGLSAASDALASKAYDTAVNSSGHLFNVKIDDLDAAHDKSEAQVSRARDNVIEKQMALKLAKTSLSGEERRHGEVVKELSVQYADLCSEFGVPNDFGVFTDDALKAVAKEAAEAQAIVGAAFPG